jgi:methylenetetrahydrofolate--tRNA-(uracil-5-)-methyltransferase
MTKINIIGGGLAGCEAAWQLAKRGYEVEIFEMRNDKVRTFAHQTSDLAELVCSNSLRSDDIQTAIGILHQEMRILDSLIMKAADNNKIPAGSALAVDRVGFSQFIKNQLIATKKVTITRQEITNFAFDDSQSGLWIIASGPLTSDNLAKQIAKYSQEENLAFFDAIAPIIYKDSINFDIAWKQSRYNKGEGSDYINCPLNKQQYQDFVTELLNGKKTEFKEWEKNTPYFDGCLPVEIVAQRGFNSLRFGNMKPVGLRNQHYKIAEDSPNFDKKLAYPFAVVQLRQDNKIDTIYNMVGFQTKLIYSEQQRIFRTIPGLENAEFARLGGIHRNSFINSPKLLNKSLSFKNFDNIKFAGQITGVEGYVESASMGLLSGIFMAKYIEKSNIEIPNNKTAIGSLLNHITEGHCGNNFQPMNINFGLFASFDDEILLYLSNDANNEKKIDNKFNKQIAKSDRRNAYGTRAIQEIEKWKNNNL